MHPVVGGKSGAAGVGPAEAEPEGRKALVRSGLGAHGLLWAGLQPRLRRACGTATRRQVPSRTPNGHSRQHKGGSEFSGAATLSPIHSSRDAATVLAPRPTAGEP